MVLVEDGVGSRTERLGAMLDTEEGIGYWSVSGESRVLRSSCVELNWWFGYTFLELCMQ